MLLFNLSSNLIIKPVIASHPLPAETAPRESKQPWPARSRTAGVVKRTLDLLGSAVLLLLFSPVIAVVGLLVKWQDGGTLIYRRKVVGPGGEFCAFKLRSMMANAEETLQGDQRLRAEFERNFKLRVDPRVTPVGKVIRRFSLDELPQLFNVLKGEMSLVGPRMISPAELERFGEAGWIFRRMKPGLTGYWQVYGRQEVSYATRVQMETFYAEHWSLWLDVKILLKTPMAVLRGSGAY
jgi:lipopolysaccharide/colanic/teichoic acid biosynthesis glycosyltransferase